MAAACFSHTPGVYRLGIHPLAVNVAWVQRAECEAPTAGPELMNRRHKAVLFLTLVLTGSSLLAGAELKTALGMMMLGVTLAWALGSDAVSQAYSRLKEITSTIHLWIRLPLVMTLAGCVFGGAVVLSKANPVLAMAAMCILGTFAAPFTHLPPQRNWLLIPLWLLALTAFFLAIVGSISLDESFSQYAGRAGQLAVTGFIALLVGIFWLSKGWKLIQKGISVQVAPELDPTEGSQGKALRQYIFVLLGVIALTFWLGVATWSASSDWSYAPQKVIESKSNNNLVQETGFILLLAWLPYSIWKKILDREPNSDIKNLRRHRQVTSAAGMIFSVVLCFAVTFGFQNGNDRVLNEKITSATNELVGVEKKIGAIKQRDLKTTSDYIQAYSEIEPLLPEFDSKIQQCVEIYEDGRQLNERRGPINIQRFYKRNSPKVWQNSIDMFELIRQVSVLTKQETLTASNMAARPESEQPEFWQSEFKPLLEQEDTLRSKILILTKKM